MTNIYLVRHGQDQDNINKVLNGHRDTELTETGEKQAEEAGEKLKNANISVIYSSPLKRAYNTAKIIANKIGIKDIILDDRLMERDFGILSGKLIADIPKYSDKILKARNENYFLEVDGGETYPTIYEKAQHFLRDLFHQKPKENVLVVTHGDTGGMIRTAYYQEPWEKEFEKPYFQNAEIIKLTKN